MCDGSAEGESISDLKRKKDVHESVAREMGGVAFGAGCDETRGVIELWRRAQVPVSAASPSLEPKCLWCLDV